MSKTLTINGTSHDINLPDDVPLLWVLRDELGLTGTKFGCGVAACGACTVHIDESLGQPDNLSILQQAWVDHQVAQCGYCQSGQIMQAAALLAETPAPTDSDIDAAMQGNLCRCGTYPRIRAAIHDAAAKMQRA